MGKILYTFLGTFTLALLMGTSYNMADYENYCGFYASSINFDFDFFDYGGALWFGYSRDSGYTLINYYANYSGFNYIEFKTILSLLCMLALSYWVYRLSNNCICFLILYLIYPFFMDVIQIRNYIVEIILFYALYDLSQNKNTIKYVLFVLIAASFHSLALVYLPFAFFYALSGNFIVVKLKKMLLLLGAMMPIYAPYIEENMELIGLLLSNDSGIQHYERYTTVSMGYGYLYAYLFILIVIIYLRKYKNIFMHNNFFHVVYDMYFYLLMLSPLYAVNGNMTRIPRNLMLPLFVIMSMTEWRKNKDLSFIALVVVIFLFGWFDLYKPGTGENVLLILQNNIFADFFIGE